MNYNDWRQWDVFMKQAYMQKWMRIVKWNTGYWKSVIVIGDYPPNPNVKIVEVVNNGGIFTLPKKDIYEYNSKLVDKSWKDK